MSILSREEFESDKHTQSVFTDVTFPAGENGLHRHGNDGKTEEDVQCNIAEHERKNEHSARCRHPKHPHEHMFDYL